MKKTPTCTIVERPMYTVTHTHSHVRVNATVVQTTATKYHNNVDPRAVYIT